MAEPDLDLDAVSVHVREKMKAQGLSLRAAAKELGCSAATLGRILKGSAASSYPDSKTLFTVIAWVGKSIADFEKKDRTKVTTVADIEVHLRSLTGLDEKDIDALVAIVRAARDKGMELRSQKK